MRPDGKRAKNVDNMYTIAAYIMDKRNDATNSLTVRIPYEPMREYINEKRKEGKNISYMGLVICAYVRAMAKYPAINRFVVNKRIYVRKGIQAGMVVQRADGAEGTMSKMSFEVTDTIDEVTEKIDAFVNQNRDENANSTDALMGSLAKAPFLLSIVIGVYKWLDKHGLLPKSLIDASPFHCSFVISNLASIRMNHIHHHVYNFGTCTSILTMGNIQSVPKMKGGQIVLEKMLPIGVVCDERVCSGAYYSKAFAEIKRLLKNPELLESRPETVVEDF